MKPVKFHPSALEFIRKQSVEIRRQIGEGLRDIQKGLMPGMPLNRAMPSVAPGVYELRVRDKTNTVRVFHIAKKADAIYVFHAFDKKTQKTPPREIELARSRLKEVMIDENKTS